MGGQLAELERSTSRRFADAEKAAGVRFAAMEAQQMSFGRQLERQTNRLILWSFAFWVTTLAGVATLLMSVR